MEELFVSPIECTRN